MASPISKRPCGALARAIVLKEADRVVHVNEGERRVTMTMIEAIMRSLAVNAAPGPLRSQQTFVKLVSETERANKADYAAYLGAVIEYKVSWEEEFERRAREGVSGPEPITHPDDIEVDLDNNRVIVKGPRTKEEKSRGMRCTSASEIWTRRSLMSSTNSSAAKARRDDKSWKTRREP
jgi:Family of unknown function (DUF5681)